MLVLCWAGVVDGVPTLNLRWFTVKCMVDNGAH